MISISHQKVCPDNGSDPFMQTFAISNTDSNYTPFPIYPLHEKSLKGGTVTDEKIIQIEKYFRDNYAS